MSFQEIQKITVDSIFSNEYLYNFAAFLRINKSVVNDIHITEYILDNGILENLNKSTSKDLKGRVKVNFDDECKKIKQALFQFLKAKQICKIINGSLDDYQAMPDWVKDNESCVYVAFKKDLMSLNEASSRLRNDKDFMINLIKENPFAFCFAGNELKKDKKFVLEVCKHETSEELKNDKEFVLEAIKHDFNEASEELKNDKEFI